MKKMEYYYERIKFEDCKIGEVYLFWIGGIIREWCIGKVKEKSYNTEKKIVGVTIKNYSNYDRYMDSYFKDEVYKIPKWMI